ncbi:MAG: 30S ribosomal protein S6 [Deltaproteobacteria bacterium]|nr:30S ribosomal protein S6 [Deltaproteobacteria bacterium]
MTALQGGTALRIYELCLIFHNDTTDEQQDQMTQSIAAIVARHGGSVLKTEKWGKKNFKYVIKKQSKGHYCFVIFESQSPALPEIERSIMYNESILRYNFIRLEKFVDAPVAPAGDDVKADTEVNADTEGGTETVAAEQAAEIQE